MSFTPPTDVQKALDELAKAPIVPGLPESWNHVGHAQAKSPSFREMREHIGMNVLYHPTEFPYEDGPFDTGIEGGPFDNGVLRSECFSDRLLVVDVLFRPQMVRECAFFHSLDELPGEALVTH